MKVEIKDKVEQELHLVCRVDSFDTGCMLAALTKTHISIGMCACPKKIEMSYENILFVAVHDFEAQTVTWPSIPSECELKCHANS